MAILSVRLDGLLANATDGAEATMSLNAALRLSERFLGGVKSLPVASVPEDIEALSMKAKVEEVLNAYSWGSEARASLLASLRRDVETQLKVLREQGRLSWQRYRYKLIWGRAAN